MMQDSRNPFKRHQIFAGTYLYLEFVSTGRTPENFFSSMSSVNSAAELRNAYKAIQLLKNDLKATKEKLIDVENKYVVQSRELEQLQANYHALQDDVGGSKSKSPELLTLQRKFDEKVEECQALNGSLQQERLESERVWRENQKLVKRVEAFQRQLQDLEQDRVLQQQQKLEGQARPIETTATAAWKEESLDVPVPTFGIRSMEVEHVLQSWTSDENKRQYVRDWFRQITTNRLAEESAVEFTDLSYSVLNAFRILVVPLLRQYSSCQIKVHTKQLSDVDAATDEPEDQRWDLRIWAVPKGRAKKCVTRLSLIQQRLAQLQHQCSP